MTINTEAQRHREIEKGFFDNPFLYFFVLLCLL
jgi:hypothetical protein